MAIPLPPGSSPIFTDSRTELTRLPQLSSLQILGTDRLETARFQQYLHCCTFIRFHRNVFTEPLPRNGPGVSSYLAVVA
jgi:hypothetical protein